MCNVEGEGLKTPLLWCHGMMGAAKPDAGAGLRPVDVSVVGKVEGRGDGNIMGEGTRGGTSKFVCCNRGIGGEAVRGRGCEKKSAAKGPRPPRWLTVKGMRAVCCALSAEMMSLPWEEWEVRP
jgi:hypothetical protein